MVHLYIELYYNMVMSIEFIRKAKLTQNKIYLPKEARDRLNVKNGDSLTWFVNKEGEIFLRKTVSHPNALEGINTY